MFGEPGYAETRRDGHHGARRLGRVRRDPRWLIPRSTRGRMRHLARLGRFRPCLSGPSASQTGPCASRGRRLPRRPASPAPRPPVPERPAAAPAEPDLVESTIWTDQPPSGSSRKASSSVAVSSGRSSARKWPQSSERPRTSGKRSPQTRITSKSGTRCPLAPHRTSSGTSDRAAEVGLVVDEVDRRPGAVVLAGGVNRRGVAEAALVLGHRLGVEVGPGAPAAEHPVEEVLGLGADHPLGQPVRLDQEEPVEGGGGDLPGSSPGTPPRSGRCRAGRASSPAPGGRRRAGARRGRRDRGRRARNARSRAPA